MNNYNEEPYGDQTLAIGISIALGIVFAAIIIFNFSDIIHIFQTEGVNL